MSQELYLTTDARLSIDAYICRLWLAPPELFEPTGEWRHGYATSVFVGYGIETNLAAFGWPPPGKIRVIEIGEYEEEDDGGQ